MAKVEGLVLSGEIANDFKSKIFEVKTKPEYREFDDDYTDNDGNIKTQKKRIEEMNIQMVETEDHYLYRPNKTSVKAMVKMYGAEMDAWVEKRFEFIVSKQNCFGKMMDVITVLVKKEV